MTINKLSEILNLLPLDTVFSCGFHKPHSYRGNYEDLAVEPKNDVTVASMLSCLEQAIGETYRGYKGGNFTMNGCEDVYLAYEGCCGTMIEGVKITECGYEIVTREY